MNSTASDRNTSKIQTIAVGMSGGIDSTMTAALLLRQGYKVVGLTMQVWDGSLAIPDEGRSGCYGPGEARDLEAAQMLAARLGIPHHIIPMADDYRTEVLDYFREEYRAGRTPNPCVKCNRTMKFGLLLERARAMGIEFDRFATGHYARVEFSAEKNRYLLRKGRDPEKDQSYFLARLSQDQLSQVMFPLGDLTKDAVRKLATDIGWTDLVEKPESQNFIESKHYGVLFGNEASQPGPILDVNGKRIGTHEGIVHYTVGQRKGLNLGGNPTPLYVISVDSCSNTIIVGTKENLYSHILHAHDLNWIGGTLPSPNSPPLSIHARIRQQHHEAPATLIADPENSDAVTVTFQTPQMSITPGQTVVFYEGDIVLGSGIIDRPASAV